MKVVSKQETNPACPDKISVYSLFLANVSYLFLVSREYK